MDPRNRVANSVDDLKASQSVAGWCFLNVEALNARIAIAVKKTIHGTNFKTKNNRGEHNAQKVDAAGLHDLRVLWRDGHSRAHP